MGRHSAVAQLAWPAALVLVALALCGTVAFVSWVTTPASRLSNGGDGVPLSRDATKGYSVIRSLDAPLGTKFIQLGDKVNVTSYVGEAVSGSETPLYATAGFYSVYAGIGWLQASDGLDSGGSPLRTSHFSLEVYFSVNASGLATVQIAMPQRILPDITVYTWRHLTLQCNAAVAGLGPMPIRTYYTPISDVGAPTVKAAASMQVNVPAGVSTMTAGNIFCDAYIIYNFPT